ncbi:MAG: endo-alpha-N-acetylgalactosaminidase family protein [Bacteroidia bacterium]|nr:endo-alpha-N-acetylgalactosaminidase family protein [Bacteroidia bacterium]
MKAILCSIFLFLSFSSNPGNEQNLTGDPSGKVKGNSFIISNEFLEVTLYPDKPIIRSYTYKPTNSRFEGADETGTIVLNGQSIPWDQWNILVKEIKVPVWQGTWYTYQMSVPGKSFRFDLCFMLVDHRMIFQLKNIQDPKAEITSVAWKNLPLLTCANKKYEYWRFRAGAPDPASGGKMWTYDERGILGSAEPGEAPSIHGVIYLPDELAVFGFGNYPLLPYLHCITPEKKYQIGPNAYQYRVRNVIQQPLQFEVVFLQDINQDKRADHADYALWVNRRIPDLDQFYFETLWYKVFLAIPDFGVVTTLKQTEEIVSAIENVTDGIPQAPHLVGWQYKGHDTFYPSYGDINTDIGGAYGISQLGRYCKNHNALLTFHSNIDDAYRNSLHWDDKFIFSNMSEFGINGSVSHCLDVESGQAFKRFDEMFKFVKLQKTLQIDNTRVSVNIPEKGIGLAEELIAGLMPVAEYFRNKGVSLTTEGQNGLPFDLTKVFAGMWHSDFSRQALPIWHRKLVGGGRGSHFGHLTRMDYALGSSIHQDISYKTLNKETIDPVAWKNNDMDRWCPPGGLTLSFQKDWDLIVQVIYEGTFLYHFYLEREMTNYQEIPDGLRTEFNNGEVVMTIINNELVVKYGETIVAHNEERFIPRNGAVYAYSRDGGSFEWVLPEEFTGKKLKAFSLSKEGKKPFNDYKIAGKTITMKLGATAPVKLVIDTILTAALD